MVENLKFVRNYQPSLVLEATLYHGTTQLCSPFSATAKVVGNRINWSERVTFSVKQKDLPKVSKLIISAPAIFRKCYSILFIVEQVILLVGYCIINCVNT